MEILGYLGMDHVTSFFLASSLFVMIRIYQLVVLGGTVEGGTSRSHLWVSAAAEYC